MSSSEVIEALEELQEELEEIERLASHLEVEVPDSCERCNRAIGDVHGRLSFTPHGHEVDPMDVHLCVECIDDVEELLDGWYPYDRQFLSGVIFGNETWRGTDCASCHSEISRKPTIATLERVKPDGFEALFPGDFLICESCREDLAEEAARKANGLDGDENDGGRR